MEDHLAPLATPSVLASKVLLRHSLLLARRQARSVLLLYSTGMRGQPALTLWLLPWMG